MARIKQKGKAGAAKAYVTRSSAVKKLQCSLADFRRLCILKGIFPREPRHRKRANKGSSAPTSFYYAKDIAYLAHEPILKKLREHKAFAKKLARALGRGEWSSAKSLEENKPVYRLDHIIKERYPTFIDAVRDIDDALCLIFLFASLPSNPRISPSLIANCARLSNEWQLYVMHSKSLRKVFLSIKGIYYQAEVMDQPVTWLVPYMFPQAIPSDVDIRVMLTFLELYQTLLGFVFFKLYTDLGLIYPPPMDVAKDDSAAGIGAFSLQETRKVEPASVPVAVVEVDGKKITGKDVRQTIKTISATSNNGPSNPTAPAPIIEEEKDEEFVLQPSSTSQLAALPTLQSLQSSAPSAATKLFASLNFYLSRETPRPLMEFIIRAFGGRVGWPESSGSGSPYDENDEGITHVIIDRPLVPGQSIVPPPQPTSQSVGETEEIRERKRRRKYVQPQWVVDCINAGKLLKEDKYERGKILPPHLSPFGEGKDTYIPDAEGDEEQVDGIKDVEMEDGVSDSESEEENNDDEEESPDQPSSKKALKALAANAQRDLVARRAAELEAEAAGVDFGAFEKAVKKEKKASKQKPAQPTSTADNDKGEEMNKMLMSNNQRKLYEKMKYGERKREAERTLLVQKKATITKDKLKEAKRQKRGKV